MGYFVKSGFYIIPGNALVPVSYPQDIVRVNENRSGDDIFTQHIHVSEIARCQIEGVESSVLLCQKQLIGVIRDLENLGKMELAFGGELGYYFRGVGVHVIHYDSTQRQVVEIGCVTAHNNVLSPEVPSVVGNDTGGIVIGIKIYYMVIGGDDSASGASYGGNIACNYIVAAYSEILILCDCSV